ncbi:hypothetical protein CDIK_0895 [Cucumispora dikerogammari]|nr:hypothetical protein CDIK_0896 [Cucumispora dikerogammari]KAF7700667.1 hypothetical protein CDIK_0895 [Cucumispora dikerogammari]
MQQQSQSFKNLLDFWKQLDESSTHNCIENNTCVQTVSINDRNQLLEVIEEASKPDDIEINIYNTSFKNSSQKPQEATIKKEKLSVFEWQTLVLYLNIKKHSSKKIKSRITKSNTEVNSCFNKLKTSFNVYEEKKEKNKAVVKNRKFTNKKNKNKNSTTQKEKNKTENVKFSLSVEKTKGAQNLILPNTRETPLKIEDNKNEKNEKSVVINNDNTTFSKTYNTDNKNKDNIMSLTSVSPIINSDQPDKLADVAPEKNQEKMKQSTRRLFSVKQLVKMHDEKWGNIK